MAQGDSATDVLVKAMELAEDTGKIIVILEHKDGGAVRWLANCSTFNEMLGMIEHTKVHVYCEMHALVKEEE